MSRKIKLHSLHFLFQIFSFLADKTGGWRLFVKPKLIIGSLILSLGFTACNTKSNNSTTSNSTSAKDSNNIESLTECYAPIAENNLDTIEKNISTKKTRDIKNNNIDSKADSIDSFILSLKPDKIIVEIDTAEQYEIISTCYKVIENDSNSIYEVVEQMPEFQGGEREMFKFIGSNIKYPSNIGEVQGRVICRFIVEKDGKIGKIEVVRSVYPDLDKEAIRIIRSMPKWIPGKQNGLNVNVWFMLPINFKLQ